MPDPLTTLSPFCNKTQLAPTLRLPVTILPHNLYVPPPVPPTPNPTPNSVLIHILPGIAIFMDRHYPALSDSAYSFESLLGPLGRTVSNNVTLGSPHLSSLQWIALLPLRLTSFVGSEDAGSGAVGWMWTMRYLVLAPLAFYIAWQLCYFLVVQVGRSIYRIRIQDLP